MTLEIPEVVINRLPVYARALSELARAKAAVRGDSILGLDLTPDEACLRVLLGQRAEATTLVATLLRARPLLQPVLLRDPLLGPLVSRR